MDNGIDSDRRSVEAALTDQSSPTAIGYRKLRSPRFHGQSLQVPPLTSVDQVWKSNLEIRPKAADLKIGNSSLFELQTLGRTELVELATRYTSRYLDIDAGFSEDNIVMAGHQPELFHPGVWYKNFVLSELGKRFNCAAINLIVDNDICGNASVRCPKVMRTDQDTNVSVGAIPIDGPGPTVPFEAREIQDWKRFEGFAGRVEQAMRGIVDSPIVTQLWPHVIAAVTSMSGDEPRRLGHALAAGRHRLEHQFGLQTLEVPVSWVAGSRAFALFADSILMNATRFQSIYNDVLKEYRAVHGIRSRSHPVPELETREGWTESPFWIWQRKNPFRRRLFSRKTDRDFRLTDLAGWEKTIKSDKLVESFRELANEGIAVRPKALMTTMFSRLILSDLFLHGIGGSKYDQLTDVLAIRYYSISMPEFLTLSATMKLPTDLELVSRSDVVAIDQLIRELKFHPELHIERPSDGVTELIKQKRDWTVGVHYGERSKEKHLAIEALNQELSAFVNVDPDVLIASRKETARKIRASEILSSREYSFCLFPVSLIQELKTMADTGQMR